MAPKISEQQRAERVARIQEAALICFARTGYHQTTMDDIVRESGLSKGGVYGHFRSKQELFVSLAGTVLSTMGLLRPIVEAEASAFERLRNVFAAMEAYAGTPEFERLVPLLLDVWVQNRTDPDVNAVIQRIYADAHALLSRLLEDGVASGEFRAVDISPLASALGAMYDGLLVQWMLNDGELDWSQTFAAVLNVLESGLRRPPEDPHTEV